MLLLNCHCEGFHNGWLLPSMLLVQSCMWLSDCDSVPPHHRCESVTPADTHVDAAANVKSGSPTSKWVGEPALGIVRPAHASTFSRPRPGAQCKENQPHTSKPVSASPSEAWLAFHKVIVSSCGWRSVWSTEDWKAEAVIFKKKL